MHTGRNCPRNTQNRQILPHNLSGRNGPYVIRLGAPLSTEQITQNVTARLDYVCVCGSSRVEDTTSAFWHISADYVKILGRIYLGGDYDC